MNRVLSVLMVVFCTSFNLSYGQDNLPLIRKSMEDAHRFDFNARMDCNQSEVQFQNLSTFDDPVSSYYWDFGDGIGFSTAENPSYKYDILGQYRVKFRVVTKEGLTRFIEKKVEVKYHAEAPLVQEVVNLCEGDKVLLTAKGSTPSLEWYSSENLSELIQIGEEFSPKDLKAGQHSFYVVDPNACKSNYSIIRVMVSGNQALQSVQGPFCESDKAVTLLPAVSGGFWTGTGIKNGHQGIFDPSLAGVGEHELLYTHDKLCGANQKIKMVVKENPTAEIFINESGRSFQFFQQNQDIQELIWDFGDGYTSVSSDANHIYERDGKFTVKLNLTDQNGCKAGIVKEVTALKNKGNDALLFRQNMKVYPVPAFGGNITVDLSNCIVNEDVSVVIYDMIGNQVYDARIKKEANHKKNLDLGMLNKGTYFLMVQSGEMASSKRISIK